MECGGGWIDVEVYVVVDQERVKMIWAWIGVVMMAGMWMRGLQGQGQ